MNNCLKFSFLILILITLSIHAETYGKKPVISSTEKFWDFGFVPFDYDLVHYYEVQNSGDENLYITDIGTSCDCTHARAIDTLIPPGGTSKIKVNFSTKNYYGKNTRTVAISSNDPDTPTFNLEFLSLIGALPKNVEAVPNALFFLPPHKEKEIKLLNKSGSPIETIIALEPDSIFSIDKREARVEPGQFAVLKVVPRDNLKPGTYQSSFTVDFMANPPIRITVPVKIVRY